MGGSALVDRVMKIFSAADFFQYEILDFGVAGGRGIVLTHNGSLLKTHVLFLVLFLYYNDIFVEMSTVLETNAAGSGR